MGKKRRRRRLSSGSASSSKSKQPTGAESRPSISPQTSEDESSAPSVVSMKSDMSMGQPLSFGVEPSKSAPFNRGKSSALSVVSMKSDISMGQPLSFGVEPIKSEPFDGGKSSAPSVVSMKSDMSMGQPLSFGVEPLKREIQSTADQSCTECGKKPRTDHEQHGDTKKETGNGDQGSCLNNIYTELVFSTGESEGPHEEHTFRHIKHKVAQSAKRSIKLSEIFKTLPDQEKPHRTVLTKGIAGIGKSFSVQKFILDWAEGRENQDMGFIFCLAFREVNLSRDDKSLRMLLNKFHPTLKSFKDAEDFNNAKVIVILDGLDESRIKLDFQSKTVTSISEVTSLGNLFANLIQGNLLPNAKLWITSRPAAANQIPSEFVDMVTEIRGFSDPQKEEYFRRRFSDDTGLAERIISHIQSSQSLDIMCQIPIFCWMSAVLFQENFGRNEKAEIPQTLTEMMAHFLYEQTKRRNRKYGKQTEKIEGRLLKTHREFLLKLGKLAFVQLLENNLIFYEEDLEECGIKTEEATIYSGFCNAVLRKEVFSQNQVFFFVHLTVQEFFAALFVYDCFIEKNLKELHNFLNLEDKEHTLLVLLKMTVEKVLKRENGHLDFFLRFLLGLMVEANRRILEGLLTSPDPSENTDKKILSHLKAIRRKDLSPDYSVNLFQSMVEMRDHKVKDEIQEYLRLQDRSKTELSPLHCSALAYMLQVSKNDLDMLELKRFNTSEEGRRRLIPAVRSSKVAILADCKVTEEWVEYLASGLKFPYLPLRELDLSTNDLKDSGVKLLCDGLSSKCCRLETLKLSGCLITKKGCGFLVSALQSNPSHLKKLDLSYNNLGESGVKMLSKLKSDPQYELSTLNVEHDGIHRMKPGLMKYACDLTFDPNTAHKNLVLSEGNRKVTWVKKEQPHSPRKERFDPCQQVLCEQGLNGRCYWEVEVTEPFKIGLMYKTTGRKKNVCNLGTNSESWCLTCSNDVLHHNDRINVSSFYSRSSRVGVFLDWPAGILSFYRVSSDSRVQLHTFREKFREPLYPAIELSAHSSAFLCQLT